MSATLSNPLLPPVESFLGRGSNGGFVGGKAFQSSSGSTIATIDPGSGATLAEVSAMTAEEVDQAVQVANDTFKNSY